MEKLGILEGILFVVGNEGISVRPTRHSYNLIKETGEFVINLTTKDLAYATDWCGVKSGTKVDKFKEMHLNKENGNYYMSSHPIRCMFDFNLNRENEQKLFWMQYGVDLRISCIEERMKFEKYTMYDLIVNYKKFFNV